MRLVLIFCFLILLLVPVSAREQSCAVSPPDETPMTVPASWLSQNVENKNLVIFHIGPKADYDAAHIPGAQFIELRDLSLSREETNLGLELPPLDRLKAMFEKYGISNDTRIILYWSSGWYSPTTRVYFTLDYMGLGANTSILEGGLPAWTAAAGKATKDLAKVNPGTLKVTAHEDVVARATYVKANLDNSKVKIIDARDPPFFTGANAGGYTRAGRIKGAKNIPFNTNFDKEGNFLPKDQLQKKFSDAGVGPYDQVVTYCHIGQQGTVDYFVAKMLGFKVKLYDGSFDEWSQLGADYPVENPEGNQGKVTVSIVSPQWLEQHSGDANLRILDVRLNVYDYFTGHVPNSVNIADAALRAPSEGTPAQYLPIFQTGNLFATSGIKKGDAVAVYSDGDGVLGATMAAYLLERVSVNTIYIVDGGWKDYKGSSLKTTQEFPSYKATQPDILDNQGVRATFNDVKSKIGSEVKFIDARPPDVYRGENKIWARNGHIPGAYSIPWKGLVEETNLHKFKSVDDMRKVYTDKGFKETDDIIVYCGTSREASLEYFVLKHVLKFPKVRLYEGSWTEYSNHADAPIETGAGK